MTFCTKAQESGKDGSGKSKFTIFSKTAVVVVKHFQGRTNISLTFLFPRLDCGIIISDFEKITFFDSGGILGVFSPPKRPFFAVRTFLKIPLLFEEKKEKFFAIFQKNFEAIREYFLDLLGPYTRLEIAFLEKKSKKVAPTSTLPLGQLTA